ncbi:MAG: hypothetical protein ACRELC_06050 [Gemmatimonadota bacterium]
MKRLMCTTLLAISLSGTASAQIQPPTPATTLWLLDSLDGTEGDCRLSAMPDPKVKLGERVTVRNGTSSHVTLFQRQGFWTLNLGSGAEKMIRIHGAGTYLSACVPGQWDGPLRARPTAPRSPDGDAFTVTWAGQSAPNKWRYGVQYRIGQRAWKRWKAATALRSDSFHGTDGKTYSFRARTIRPASGQKSDWSPTRKVVT